jgi:Protein of unknown function (DUF3105)
VGKKAQTRRQTTRAASPRWAAEPEPSRRVGLRAVLAVVCLLVVGSVIAVVAFAAASTPAGPASLPAGTQTFAETNHSHVTGTVTYDHMPPAGGAHNPVQLNCGIYNEAVPNENAVHSLEHGAVWITYQPTLPADQVAALQQFVAANYVGTERYLILSPYPGIPSPIVASAWGAQLGLDQASDPRLAQFVQVFAGGGQGGEKGGPCTGGVGSPIG